MTLVAPPTATVIKRPTIAGVRGWRDIRPADGHTGAFLVWGEGARELLGKYNPTGEGGAL